MDTAAGNAAAAGRYFSSDTELIMRELDRIHHRIDMLASKMGAIDVINTLQRMEESEVRIIASVRSAIAAAARRQRERERAEPEVTPV